MRDKGRHTGGIAATEHLPIKATGIEKFVRFSPYPDDKRIDTVNMRLRPGSYTTKEEDYKICKAFSNEPIDRYALPSDEKINWAYYIQPKSYDQYRPGIVQPANNHSGGGIEVLFDNGTSNNTYLRREQY